MAFWLFMLIMNLLIPLTMIGFGFLFKNHPPKEINGVYGYRTALSMKNEDTWKTAHLLCGRIWFVWGWISAIFSLPCMLLLYGKKRYSMRHLWRPSLFAAMHYPSSDAAPCRTQPA